MLFTETILTGLLMDSSSWPMPLYLNNKTLSDYQVLTSTVMAEGNSKLSEAQAQVGEVVDVMRVNVEKVLERDNKLSELNSRADNLQAGANQFQTQVIVTAQAMYR